MLDYNDSKDTIEFRAKIAVLVIVFLSVLLIANLYLLQIYRADKYALLSDKNRIRLSIVLPKRGRIITSDGKIVAKSARRYKLVIDHCNEENFHRNMAYLSKCINLNEDDKTRIYSLRKKNPYSVIVKDRLSWDEYSKLSIILFKLYNVSIENEYIRDYTMSSEFSHIVGHVSKNNNAQALVGRTGIEAVLNDQLVGKIGNTQIEVNSIGKKVRVLNFQNPTSGADITITIDSQLQKYVYDLLSLEKAGACVVIDILNGEILALVSVPAFDSNLMSNRMTHTQWNSIINDPLFPLINRATSCSYPPGSIFKIIVAFAAISDGIVSPTDRILCTGGVKQDDHVFHCWNRCGHGKINLFDALKFSCDCYFFKIAKKLGINRIIEYARKFGFGAKTCEDLYNENIGLLPTKEWKLLKYGTGWNPCETMIAGIGQGAVLATLMQIATMMGKFYSEDYNFSPIIIKGKKKKCEKNPINSECTGIIKEALRHVCESGTASSSCNVDYGISGKTGSSQVKKMKSDEAGIDQKNLRWEFRDHAFFVGVAPNKNPRYVVAVFVEHGGSGAKVAAPIARQVFDKLMGK